MDDGWDLHAVVRSCAATSTTVSSSAAAEIAPASAAVATSSSLSFDDERSTHEQPSTSNFISFSINPVEDSEHHARKRKSKNNKRVVELSEEEYRNDGWAWRKYGKKPIKSSPYPRCSTTRDCSARKKVDRSPMDPSKFIVSYSGDHLHPQPTHPSSLAGTTRITKFTTTMVTDLPKQTPCSSSSSPVTSLKGDDTEKNDEDIQRVNFRSIFK